MVSGDMFSFAGFGGNQSGSINVDVAGSTLESELIDVIYVFHGIHHIGLSTFSRFARLLMTLLNRFKE